MIFINLMYFVYHNFLLFFNDNMNLKFLILKQNIIWNTSILYTLY